MGKWTKGGKACHVGPKKVMQIGKTMVYAGSWAEVAGDFNWSFILRMMDGGKKYPTGIVMNKQAQLVFPVELLDIPNPPIIDIDWEDFSVPSLDHKWWVLLNESIKKLPKGNMLVHCIGGHGRTGTALAILAGLNGYYKKKSDPVATVRERYCPDAVESSEQIEYIETILDIPIYSEAAWGMGAYGGILGKAANGTKVSNTVNSATTGTAKEPVPAKLVGTEPTGEQVWSFAGVLYREGKDGMLVEVGEDDGSWEGPNLSKRNVTAVGGSQASDPDRTVA